MLMIVVFLGQRFVSMMPQGHPIPEDFALDSDGKPTTNPDAALSGTMPPIGDPKGTALAFKVEIPSAALTSSSFCSEVSSF